VNNGPDRLRDVKRSDQIVPNVRPAADPPEVRARRVEEQERRIHNHPCPCGSGKRYVDCCINRMDQAERELRHRRRIERQKETPA
jgi:hypothetical protein